MAVARRTPSNRKGDNNTFNPQLIFSQILALQCFHYLFLGVLFQINHVFFGTSVSLDRIFSDKYVGIWSALGWVDSMAILMAEAMGSVLLAIIVEKSKKCLDFSVTLFLIHFIFSTLYGGFPHTWDWWIVHISGTIMMILLGEYICSRRELDDIPLLQL
eukprot:Nitzschia sp. Nitz4//scaffold22_size323478//189974//190450//NITZ4_000552-RA/size323478-exonerate_protein2genome-gene-0.45-mRNA-1//1//CDS//3329543070//9237//frame0